ncbi:MAG: hypothetical protein VKJ87_03600 [Synechococcus sp.]|nr:hypothetical protein [Synechococcus sp.]
MSFDPRSLERLKQLGRQLPQPLQAPQSQPEPKPERRHRVETEEDPQELFRQLMQVSADGTVPEHLMARLRQLERDQPKSSAPAPSASGGKAMPMKQRQNGASSDSDDELYTAFQQLLLEEDD